MGHIIPTANACLSCSRKVYLPSLKDKLERFQRARQAQQDLLARSSQPHHVQITHHSSRLCNLSVVALVHRCPILVPRREPWLSKMAGLNAAFSAIDANNDGVITREEYEAAQRRAAYGYRDVSGPVMEPMTEPMATASASVTALPVTATRVAPVTATSAPVTQVVTAAPRPAMTAPVTRVGAAVTQAAAPMVSSPKRKLEYHTIIREQATVEEVEKAVEVPRVEVVERVEEVPISLAPQLAKNVYNCIIYNYISNYLFKKQKLSKNSACY